MDLMDTGILDLPDSEEEFADADADKGNPSLAGGTQMAAAPTATVATGTEQTGTEQTGTARTVTGSEQSPSAPRSENSKGSSVSLNKDIDGTNNSNFKYRSVSDISSRMKKTRIVSYGGGGVMKFLETRAPVVMLLLTVLTVIPGPTLLNLRRGILTQTSPPSTAYLGRLSRKSLMLLDSDPRMDSCGYLRSGLAMVPVALRYPVTRDGAWRRTSTVA